MAVKTITPEELFEKMNAQEELVLVDVRAEEKYKDFHIENANVSGLNIPKTEIFRLEDESEQNISTLPINQKLIITCTTGNSATKCANVLAERAYDVVVLKGGITAWKEFINKK
ncbi:rhodanese-like domain-containing protein [Sporosarcina sp. Sa2YVA2]|uniref:Rhodanese-like domain-containing protein n=1 Tax=Sporosarcina quadrami TaxID=2762234 RepID=A0ABR8UEP4_9BACL|nr:rhodanese-like domain-containing protein [Sporosarcina quadrami]MBD7986310.1 rhodanese-like domain-containing protein [Sporosarcina quadrami]